MSNSLLSVSKSNWSSLHFFFFLLSLNRITFSAYASVGCRCLTAFDRYACTSRSITLRQWSSLKMVYRFLMINIFLWACFALPNFFFFNLIKINSTHIICYISKQIYSDYFAYFVNPILYFAFPLIILISLTMLTHRNLRLMNKTRRLKQVERQLTSVRSSNRFFSIISFYLDDYFTSFSQFNFINSIWYSILLCCYNAQFS